MRRVLMTGLGAMALAFTALPSQAADTNTTFSITSGDLSITVPATADLGSVAAGSLILSSGALFGEVTVTDGRGALVAEWTATVSSTDFTTGGATPAPEQTVAKAAISYSSGTATTSGDGVFTPSVGVTLELPAIAGLWAGVGSNSASWTPTLTIALLESQVAGEYAGTITHSVS